MQRLPNPSQTGASSERARTLRLDGPRALANAAVTSTPSGPQVATRRTPVAGRKPKLETRTGFALSCLALQGAYVASRFATLRNVWSIEGLTTLAVLAAELALVVAWASLVWGVRRTLDRRDEAASHDGWYASSGASLPSIAILVATYDEEAAVLSRALVGATGQEYPNSHVWVLDDGCRPWVKELSAAYDCSYLERKTSSGAKAGNLNHAIREMLRRGELPDYFAVIDADFMLQPGFLRKTLALMHDPTVGLVQTPQSFFNQDPLQRAFPTAQLADDMRFAFEISQPARDAYDAAFCCGTSFLVRTEALRAIDLFPTESVTEDLLTSIRMRAQGFRTVYLNEVLSHGLAPQSLRDFVNQRKRWCTGFLHLARETVQRGPRGGLWPWLRTIEAFSRWSYASLARLFLVFAPCVYWFFGVNPLAGTGLAVAALYGVSAVSQRLYMYRISRGFYMPLLVDASALLMAPHFLSTAIAVALGKKDRFVVTAKGVLRTRTNVFWPSAAVLFAVVGLNLAGVGYGMGDWTSFGLTQGLLLAWSSLAVVVAGLGLILCVEPPSRRLARRFETRVAVTFTQGGQRWTGHLTAISESGAVFEWDGPANLSWPLVLVGEPFGDVTAHAVRASGERRVCVRFQLDQRQHAALVKFLYFACLPPLRHASFRRFLLGVVRRVGTMVARVAGAKTVEKV